jgi:hypothetical protein
VNNKRKYQTITMPISFASSGEDSFGFQSSLKHFLTELPSPLPLDSLTSSSSKINYVNELTYDPTQAKYFELFNADIEEENRKSEALKQRNKQRRTDYRLNEEELSVFKKNGFVVSERMGAARYV